MKPSVLPAGFPNLLVNGSSGIAVGMATNMPPHNLTEVLNGVFHLINNPAAPVEELMEHIPGPRFSDRSIYSRNGQHPGCLHHRKGHHTDARTRKRGKKPRTNRQSIVVTEIPFMVNKARLIETIAGLVRDKKITGISELRDESDRDGMRIVVELKRDEIAEVVLNNLYKHTQMQSSFGVINLAIIDGRPKVMTLKDLLSNFIKFRKEIVTRRTIFELKKARARAHILEGLKIAVEKIDAVIKLIRASGNPKEAKTGLQEEFSLSPIQAQAILDMKLQRLTALERDKIIAEYTELFKDNRRP